MELEVSTESRHVSTNECTPVYLSAVYSAAL